MEWLQCSRKQSFLCLSTSENKSVKINFEAEVDEIKICRVEPKVVHLESFFLMDEIFCKFTLF